jgi:hypothetical protein
LEVDSHGGEEGEQEGEEDDGPYWEMHLVIVVW